MKCVAEVIDLERFLIDRLESDAFGEMVVLAKADLAANGMFNLKGFMRPRAIAHALDEIAPLIETEAFHHAR